ncbi:putative quinol monooxygenase [Croceitalea rosinachiae]|uniref:Antibiotic biosynthesis monooxygenase family protein n=1 Tax=Croceitalea rosinachiae TaxID=3075596 RepID=A0ABU3AC98_9FLAO|nr:antibiotic biosynthesis monooxygenase family protein [Croceitalea sp. F388]MDT0607810.1 antibiotic biosynthesis monooxygenase family protein [Croceitalea sp. F388]
MLVRIVKLTFKTENISSFESLFEETKKNIRNFEGCTLLELYQDQKHPNIFFTYSYWENANNLESYRKSEFFKSVWSQTKVLFDAKPEAWSVTKKAILS